MWTDGGCGLYRCGPLQRHGAQGTHRRLRRAHVCVYEVVSGWTEYQRDLGRMDAQRTGLPLIKTPAGSVEVSVAVDVLVFSV